MNLMNFKGLVKFMLTLILVLVLVIFYAFNGFQTISSL